MLLNISPYQALATSAFLAVLFVASLYVWLLRSDSSLNRDDPKVIKQRFLSIGVVCVVAPLFVNVWASDSTENGVPLARWLGVTTVGLLEATFLPLLLTMSIFFGPLFANALTIYQSLEYHATPEIPSRDARGRATPPPKPPTLFDYLTDMVADMFRDDNRYMTLRNIIVGPFCEEWVFRSCVCSLLIGGGWSFWSTVLISPILFGAAHMHHLIGHVKSVGYSFQEAMMIVVFQLMYTTLFGAYASFVFLRTGHVIASFLSHAFCNLMGVPDFSWIRHRHHLGRYRTLIAMAFLAGIFTFAWQLYPLTDPRIYDSIYIPQPVNEAMESSVNVGLGESLVMDAAKSAES